MYCQFQVPGPIFTLMGQIGGYTAFGVFCDAVTFTQPPGQAAAAALRRLCDSLLNMGKLHLQQLHRSSPLALNLLTYSTLRSSPPLSSFLPGLDVTEGPKQCLSSNHD